MSTPTSYVGSSKARQEIGLPGHCEDCAAVGHVAAHPNLGCGDVGCNRGHEPYGPPNEDEPIRPAKLMVCMRCTGLGSPVVDIPHGIGNAFQRETVATIYTQDGGGPGWDGVLIITPHTPDCTRVGGQPASDRERQLAEDLAAALDLLRNARSDLGDPSLRMSWGRTRKALMDRDIDRRTTQ